MKVLVTGANGFIGSHLCRALLDEGHDITALVREGSNDELLRDLTHDCHSRLKISRGDVTNQKSLDSIFPGHEVVFHAAAALSLYKSEHARLKEVNVTGTQNVIEAAVRAGVRRLLHVSSVATFGMSSTRSQIIDETRNRHEIPTESFNARSKFDAERLMLEAFAHKKIEVVIANPSMVFGAGDARKEMREGIIKMAKGKVPFSTPGGMNIVGIQDVVEGIIQAAIHGKNGERYILSGENVTGQEFAELMARASSRRSPRLTLSSFWLTRLSRLAKKMKWDGAMGFEALDASTQYAWYSHAKASQELGYSPKPVQNAIEESVKWMRDNGY